MAGNMNIFLIVIVVLVVGASVAVPVFPVAYQEEYTEMVPYEEEVAYQTVVEYTEMVPYEKQVEYTEQEPYTVSESYQESVPVSKQVASQEYVNVIKTYQLFSRNKEYDVNYYYGDFSLSSPRWVEISWSSSKNVMLFAVIDHANFNTLKTYLVIEVGVAGIALILSGGVIGPGLLVGLPAAILTTVQQVLSPDEYYRINDNADTTSKYMDAGDYTLFMIIVQNDNYVDMDISYDYETTELQTVYNTVIEYELETKYRDVIKYRTVTKTRTEIEYKAETKTRIEIEYKTEIKYREETKYRIVEEKVTLFAMMTRTN